jgi:hypothetical protein
VADPRTAGPGTSEAVDGDEGPGVVGHNDNCVIVLVADKYGDGEVLTPVEARRLAARITAAADGVDSGGSVPEPLETQEEWGWRYAEGHPIVPVGPFERRARLNQKCGGGEIFRREIRMYADGSTLVGGWVPVDPCAKEGPDG